jgi:hypothetical protein
MVAYGNNAQNDVFKMFEMQLGPLKLWQWLALVALLFLLDKQGIIDVPLIGNQNGGRNIHKIRKN